MAFMIVWLINLIFFRTLQHFDFDSRHRFRFSNSTQIFFKESYTWIQQKMILCSSCVNLKQIGVVFVLLKIDLSELCHLDSSVIAFVLQTQLNTDFYQRILYLNSVKDNIMLLMCKIEANRCGFCDAEN